MHLSTLFLHTSSDILDRTFDVEGDPSVQTYRGHSIAHTLIRCYFSPSFTTGQKYIITGSSDGCIRSAYYSIILSFPSILSRLSVYDVLTGQTKLCLQANNPANSQRERCVRDISWHPYEDSIISTSVKFLH